MCVFCVFIFCDSFFFFFSSFLLTLFVSFICLFVFIQKKITHITWDKNDILSHVVFFIYLFRFCCFCPKLLFM